MRILVIHAHPSEHSFNTALRDAAHRALTNAGHEVRIIDLWREGFDPVMAPEEWHRYFNDPAANESALAAHIDQLRWAEGLCLIFPTWFYGPPAMLKGWMERVLLPGVAFEVPDGRSDLIRGKLRNIRHFLVITTSGSPRWYLTLIGNPARGTLFRGMRSLFHPKCRRRWLQLYSMDRAGDPDRARFVEKVERTLAQL